MMDAEAQYDYATVEERAEDAKQERHVDVDVVYVYAHVHVHVVVVVCDDDDVVALVLVLVLVGEETVTTEELAHKVVLCTCTCV